MKGYIATTDEDWYGFLLQQQRQGPLDEVNFWQPMGGRRFRVLSPGELRRDAPPQELPRVAESTPRYGEPRPVTPRLGQGAFRIAVTRAYGDACAVTREHSLPVIDAAHVKPYVAGGGHEVRNGVALRSDIHRLFDQGYVTFDEDRRFVVSKRLRDEFHNGKVYYSLQGTQLFEPTSEDERAADEVLAWHREHAFVA